MSMPSLDDLKKLFAEQAEKKAKGGNGKSGNSDYYPFWDMKDDESATIRVLPIANQKGAMPVVTKDHHKISIEGKDQTIACLAMYNETCPICELSRKYYKFKDDENQAKGKYYYRNRSYLMSVLVKSDPLPADPETGENSEGKVKVIQLGNQVYKKFNSDLEELVKRNELDAVPWAFKDGLDFNLVKKNGGKYAKWDLASGFARKSSTLSEDFVASFEPVDLTKFLPANPGLEKVQRMLDAHLNDGEYVEDNDSIEAKTETPVAKVERSEPVVEKAESKKPEVITEAPSEEADDDIAQMLRQLAAKRSLAAE